MKETCEIPRRVILKGIGYRVQETADQTILFIEDLPMCGYGTRFVFTKEMGQGGMWWSEVSGMGQTEGGTFSPSAFSQAFEMVREWRGDNHEPYEPRSAQDA